MSAWRDQTRIPKGMSDFQRWYRPEGIDHRKKHPADMDGIIHNGRNNSFIMMEFKPFDANLTRGQEITLEGFSKLPGCISLAIFDPYSNDTSRQEYTDDTIIKIISFKDGKKQPLVTTTVKALNARIATWFKTGK